MVQSTRSTYTVTDTEAVLTGIAPDGGLFTDPELGTERKKLSPAELKAYAALSYPETAKKIMSELLPGFADSMERIAAVYPEKFSASRITPVVKVGNNHALELYHGPTSAFKDVALSVLPLFLTEARKKLGIRKTVSVLTATSGDTGKAALEGFRDVEGTDITVFFPESGVSAMQKMQMVTQEGKNVRVCAVRGNFDDCQRGVKDAFAEGTRSASDPESGDGKLLSSANSINIGRLVPQVVYYFSAYSQLVSSGEISAGDDLDFIVPTGNFGDILAGYLAQQMGLPIGRLVCAANANNVLEDFLHTGIYDRRRDFVKTSSPSMDILVSSNLERLLFYASDGDCALVSGLMQQLKENGVYSLSGMPLQKIRQVFSAGSCSEEDTRKTIRRIWKDSGWLCDPHTAVAFHVLEQYQLSGEYTGNKCVVLSTASPFKFPAAVLSALGETNCEGLSDFAMADLLASVTGQDIPANLSALRTKPVLHTDVIRTEEIVRYALH